MKKSLAQITACVALLLCGVMGAHAQTLTTLVTFNGSNGELPGYGFLLASDGNFYGTTESGGDNTTYCSNGAGFGCGTIFQITPDGTLTTLHAFCAEENCADGITPNGGLVRGKDGELYGTTNFGGGSNFGGTVFKITTSGAFTTLYNFCSQTNCADGEHPFAGLVLASNGNFYGTTTSGGAHGFGTIFSITPAGVLTTLYNFCSQTNCTDGEFVQEALIQASNGKLYGMTALGGANNAGTVFAITLTGTFTTLHSFAYKDGSFPNAGLVQASSESLIGATGGGGTRNDGTIFEITLAGSLKTLYNFCASKYCADGAGPFAMLLRGRNGNFYGTTADGGANSRGTVFEITPSGKLTTLYSFCSQASCADGANPVTGLAQAANGDLYGMAQEGGDLSCSTPNGCGTVFSLTQ
jgi:uncharacterized repeat protein (TIGR03803 family)